MQVYEIFKQEREGEPMKHAGNLRAPDDALALHYAKEFYSRRSESIRLWVVPRASIAEIADPDILRPPLDRSHRVPAGYKINEKLAEKPELVNTDPYGDGWMVRIKVADASEIDELLMSAEEYDEFVETEAGH